MDDNDTRVLDSGDANLAGVTITLFSVSGTARTQVVNTTTDASWNQPFTNLAEGTYDVEQGTNVTSLDGLGIDDGILDLAGTFGTRTANNVIRVNLMTDNSVSNNFIWYRQSFTHLCTPSKFHPSTTRV